MKKNADEVFGMSNTVLIDSYVDRGSLDSELTRLLKRKNHIAIRGPSKCGKSWLRQKVLANSITVQCRMGSSIADIYTSALSELGVKLVVEETSKDGFKGTIEGSVTAGNDLIGKVLVKSGLESAIEVAQKVEKVGKDINDIRFIAELIIESGRRLVIEDLHYLSANIRELLAFDLKALWDYGCFVVVVGVWGQSNHLVHLNSDLSGRVEEITIEWEPDDLRSIIQKGGAALKIEVSRDIQNKIVLNSFGSAGLLQRLVLKFLDECCISEEQESQRLLADVGKFDIAAMMVAEQLNGLYQKFAERVAGGIRSRKDSTEIYAHSMAVIMEADDIRMMNGFSVDDILVKAKQRQPRINRPNLKSILTKIDALQVDKDGRGLVVTYDENDEKVLNVDRQLLFYRKYLTVNWPWDDLIRGTDAANNCK